MARTAATTGNGTCSCGPVTAAVTGDPDLAVHDGPWDAAEAAGRVAVWASSDDSGDVDTIDWMAYSRAFFWRDDQDSDEAEDDPSFDAYRLGFADVVDGALSAIADGIREVDDSLDGTDGIPDESRDSIRETVDAYLVRVTALADDGDDDADEDGDEAEDGEVTASIVIGAGADGWQVRAGRRAFRLPSRQAALALAGRIGRTRMAAADDGPAFELVPLIVENEWSRDERMVEEVWWSEDRLPLSLFAQTELSWGHDGAILVGRIDTLTRDGNLINAAGVFGTWPEAVQVAEQVDGEYLRGVSADGAAENIRLEFPPDSGPDEISDTAEDGGTIELEPVREVSGRLEIMGATLVAHPAFGDAQIRLLEPVPEPDPQLAALEDKLDWLISDRHREKIASVDAPALPPTEAERRIASVSVPALP